MTYLRPGTQSGLLGHLFDIGMSAGTTREVYIAWRARSLPAANMARMSTSSMVAPS